jgi:hypothetical protein
VLIAMTARTTRLRRRFTRMTTGKSRDVTPP